MWSSVHCRSQPQKSNLPDGKYVRYFQPMCASNSEIRAAELAAMLDQLELELSMHEEGSTATAAGGAPETAARQRYLAMLSEKRHSLELEQMVAVLVAGGRVPAVEKIVWKVMGDFGTPLTSSFQQLVGAAFSLVLRGYITMSSAPDSVPTAQEEYVRLTRKQAAAELNRVVSKMLQYNAISDSSVLLRWIDDLKSYVGKGLMPEHLTRHSMVSILIALTDGAGSNQGFELHADEMRKMIGLITAPSFDNGGHSKAARSRDQNERTIMQAKRLFRSIGPARWGPAARRDDAIARFELPKHCSPPSAPSAPSPPPYIYRHPSNTYAIDHLWGSHHLSSPCLDPDFVRVRVRQLVRWVPAGTKGAHGSLITRLVWPA